MSSAESDVWRAKCQQLINENKVMIFSKSTCPFCVKVKELLDSLAVEYVAIELDTEENGAELKKALADMCGKTSVPQVYIKGSRLGGCDDTMAAHRNGKLKELLDL